MAIINCKECKKEVSDQAKICPNCGFDLQKEKNTAITSKGCLWIFGILFAVILFVMLLPSSPDSDSNSKKLEAYVYSQEIVETKLKSPATAEFPTFQENLITESGNIYIIDSYVDSQNSFGAITRSKYSCKLRYENNLFYVESISIN